MIAISRPSRVPALPLQGCRADTGFPVFQHAAPRRHPSLPRRFTQNLRDLDGSHPPHPCRAHPRRQRDRGLGAAHAARRRRCPGGLTRSGHRRQSGRRLGRRGRQRPGVAGAAGGAAARRMGRHRTDCNRPRCSPPKCSRAEAAPPRPAEPPRHLPAARPPPLRRAAGAAPAPRQTAGHRGCRPRRSPVRGLGT